MVTSLNLSILAQHYHSFYIIDIRGIQSYTLAHLKDSLHLQSKEEILDFLDSVVIKKPLVLVCSSASRARNMADSIRIYYSSLIATHTQKSKISYTGGGES